MAVLRDPGEGDSRTGYAGMRQVPRTGFTVEGIFIVGERDFRRGAGKEARTGLRFPLFPVPATMFWQNAARFLSVFIDPGLFFRRQDRERPAGRFGTVWLAKRPENKGAGLGFDGPVMRFDEYWWVE